MELSKQLILYRVAESQDEDKVKNESGKSADQIQKELDRVREQWRDYFELQYASDIVNVCTVFLSHGFASADFRDDCRDIAGDKIPEHLDQFAIQLGAYAREIPDTVQVTKFWISSAGIWLMLMALLSSLIVMIGAPLVRGGWRVESRRDEDDS